MLTLSFDSVVVFQLSLLTPEICNTKTVSSKTMKASFLMLADGLYDIVLEINSNKFSISCEYFASQIHAFEVIAVKGFAELSASLIAILKKVVNYFFAKI